MTCSTRRLFAAWLALVVGAVACTSRNDAQAALTAAEQAITAQHADAIRYAPDEFKAIMEMYTDARARFDEGDYRETIRRAEEVGQRARVLPAAIDAGRDALRPRWEELHGSLSLMIAALEKRLEEIDRTGRRPAGVTTAALGGARANLDTLRVGFHNAAAAWDRGDLGDALHAADRLQSRGFTALEVVGVRMGPHGAR
jgi:hypothetical protein